MTKYKITIYAQEPGIGYSLLLPKIGGGGFLATNETGAISRLVEIITKDATKETPIELNNSSSFFNQKIFMEQKKAQRIFEEVTKRLEGYNLSISLS